MTAKYAGRIEPASDRFLVAIANDGTERRLERHISEPSWGYHGGGPNNAAWAILNDIYGPEVAGQLAGGFAEARLGGDKVSMDLPFTMERSVAEEWARARGVRVD